MFATLVYYSQVFQAGIIGPFDLKFIRIPCIPCSGCYFLHRIVRLLFSHGPPEVLCCHVCIRHIRKLLGAVNSPHDQ